MQSYSTLKRRHRRVRDKMHQNLSLRVHRALSWLNCSENTLDNDSKFIFLWIAFNAVYAVDLNERWNRNERQILAQFLNKMIEADIDKQIYEIVWKEFPASIRGLINNEFLYERYWDYKRLEITEEEWNLVFSKSKSASLRALGKLDTCKVLSIIFERLYTLRNQLIHGGSTWKGSVNRDQVRDGSNIMQHLIPTIISIMLS